MSVNTNDCRVSKLRKYMYEIINSVTTDRNYQINANFLSNEVDDYSLDKIPTETVVEPYITGGGIYREVYSVRSRKSYEKSVMTNLKNMGFFEQLENAIKTNNDEGNLPDINGIISIECLSPFTMILNDNGNTATFDSQIQITYEED